jgi:Fic family protein
MKKPIKPPPFKELFKELAASPEKLGRILSVFQGPIYKNRYIHWQKLQYLEPPKEISKKGWWFALKIARMGQWRDITLFDTAGNSFKFNVPDPALQYLHTIDQNTGGRIEVFDKDAVTPLMQEKYLIHSLVEEAITSSQLEGATSTRRVAKEMIRTERKPRNKSEQMILNNYRTMLVIKDKVQEPLTREMIFDIHRNLTELTLDEENAAGRFRKPDEDIRVFENISLGGEILHTPPPVHELEKRMQALCDFANGKTPSFFIHPVVRSVLLHFWLAYDHPFVDGNGRCARALFYWSMLKQGYWLCEYISISQILHKAPAKYGRSFLYTETDDNDLTYFLLYQLEVLCRAIDEFHNYISIRSKALNAAEQLLRSTRINLNHRQLDLLSHALHHPENIYTIGAHQRANRVVYQTARTDLYALADAGFLEKKKRGKEFVFLPVKDLEQKIKTKT